MIHINTGAITELFPTGKSGTPVATLLLPYNYNHTSGYSSGSSTSNSLSQQPQVLLGKDSILLIYLFMDEIGPLIFIYSFVICKYLP